MINDVNLSPETLSGKDLLFEQKIAELRLKYKMGQIPKINSAEFDILKFCHDRDMIKFLREEFEKHPIILDEDGGLVGGNPFEKERRMLASKLQQASNVTPPDNSNYEII